jgi:hypothetical protein
MIFKLEWYDWIALGLIVIIIASPSFIPYDCLEGIMSDRTKCHQEFTELLWTINYTDFNHFENCTYDGCNYHCGDYYTLRYCEED